MKVLFLGILIQGTWPASSEPFYIYETKGLQGYLSSGNKSYNVHNQRSQGKYKVLSILVSDHHSAKGYFFPVPLKTEDCKCKVYGVARECGVTMVSGHRRQSWLNGGPAQLMMLLGNSHCHDLPTLLSVHHLPATNDMTALPIKLKAAHNKADQETLAQTRQEAAYCYFLHSGHIGSHPSREATHSLVICTYPGYTSELLPDLYHRGEVHQLWWEPHCKQREG